MLNSIVRRPGVFALFWLLLVLGTAAWGDATRTVELPLARFMTEDRPLRLESAHGSRTLSIPLSPRVELRSATLELELVSSTALLKNRSQLAVQVNGRTVLQLSLDPAAPQASVRARIPAGYFHNGYNRLTFSAAQHYTEDCEDATAPELWTEIDTLASRLILETRPRDLQGARLSELQELFDPKLWEAPLVRVLTPGMLDEQGLQWGALVAQGVALRYRYVPVEFRRVAVGAPLTPIEEESVGRTFPGLSQAGLSDGDSVLIGTLEQLRPYLSESLADRIDGAFLGVFALDEAPNRLVLLVSGTTDEEVTRAARTFGFLNLPYPDTAWVRVDTLSPPVLPPYSAHGAVDPNGDYSFARLGFRTLSVTGTNAESPELNLNLPADLYAPQDATLELDLHLAYGAGLRRDSVLNLYLNGLFQTSIPLNRETGGNYLHYKVRIPLRSLQPGPNRISFEPRMLPMESGACVPPNPRALVLTLFDDSRLQMPNALHFATLPDLRRLALTGYPYLIQADGSDLRIHLPQADDPTVGAAWTLLGKFAQRKELPLHAVHIDLGTPTGDGPAVVLGTPERLGEALFENAPIRPGATSRVSYPVITAREAGEGSLGWLERRYRELTRMLTLESSRPRIESADVTTRHGGLGRYSLLMQFRSADAGSNTVTAITAADGKTLAAGVARLVQPEMWDRLEGDVGFWRDEPDSMVSHRLGADYHIGELTPWWRANFYFSRYPWILLGGVLVVTLVLAVLGRRLLRRFRRRHRPGTSVDDVSDEP